MIRKATLALTFAIVSLLMSSASQAAVTSIRNPYRSFNSGVNYGAQQWERSHCAHHHAHLVRHHR